MASPSARMAAIVLAGGEARRFGGDKLAAEIDGRALVDHALDGLPADCLVAVVGPVRPLGRGVTFLREDPPGGGPAAALITGLIWALTSDVRTIVTLPGDAPGAGRAAQLLVEELGRQDHVAVVGVDGSGRDQVLQLALRPAAARLLVDLAGPDRGHDQSVRRLVTTLTSGRLALPDDLCADIDTVGQLKDFRNLRRT
ncbi:MAG TPA: NTP transferase domain-containing protein [Microlunatus sp.]